MQYAKLDHVDPLVSERICRVLLDAYAVEARLIGAVDFPPLRRSAANIRRSDAVFYGCWDQGHLVAVAEVEGNGREGWHIASFVVHPSRFRRGIGSGLLQHVLGVVGTTRVTVSTASANAPALALYEQHGFRICRRWSASDHIDMVTLATDPA
jgi:ribosomal protein S18 acetylase RimI-like enzyme